MNGEWFVDPLGRFEGRYFDGNQWTDQVSVNGRLTVDPNWPPRMVAQEARADEIIDLRPVASAPASATAATQPDRRQGGNRRQINARRDHERRQGERRRPEIVIPRASP